MYVDCGSSARGLACFLVFFAPTSFAVPVFDEALALPLGEVQKTILSCFLPRLKSLALGPSSMY